MANTDKRQNNTDIDNEERRAPGGERTGSGSRNVESGRDSQSGTQKSNRQSGQQKGQQNDKNRNM